MTKEIPLYKNREIKAYAIVDDEDYEYLSRRKWVLLQGRAFCPQARYRKFMHRFLFEPEPGYEIDHENGNTLDNRKSNLRIATHLENSRNRKINSNNTTGYKGVCYDFKNHKYHVTLRVNAKKVFLGRFQNKIEAAKAYDAAAKKYFGEFARLNFPEGGSESPHDKRTAF